MQPQTPRCAAGTLVELLVVIAIIAIIAGLILTAAGPTRKRARQTTCLSNLRQIGMALDMYRADYGGAEISGERHAAYGFGLPYSPVALMSHLKNKDVLHCPDEDWSFLGIPPGKAISSYLWSPHPDDEPGPRFSDVVAKRGEQTVVAACEFHDPLRLRPGPGSMAGAGLVIVLRLSGQAERRIAPRKLASWEW